MNLWLGVTEGLREITSHKFRSLLTGMGIILGVASLIAMIAITNGQAIEFRKNIELWGGAERIAIVDRPVPEEQESFRDQSPGKTYQDAVALRRAPFVELVSPELRFQKRAVLQYKERRFSSRWIRGVEGDFLEIENHTLLHGRFFTDVDQRNRSRVIVLGHRVRRQLFGQKPADDVIGQSVTFNGVSFRVIGLFEDYENRWKNSVVVIPLLTMQELFFSSNVVDGVDQGPIRNLNRLVVKIKDLDTFDESIEQMRNILLQTHNGVEDFGFDTRENWFNTIESSVAGIRLSGFIVSGVTLIAAGVGITNIMMASIRERTREIGVRRALGARSSDIFSQICLEALVLAMLGGLLGIVAGYGLLAALEDLLAEFASPSIDAASVGWSFLAAVTIGFCAGVVPAFKASRMSPMEALRFE